MRGQFLFSLIMGTSAGLMLWVLGSLGIFPEGKTYAVPQVTDTLGLFYNKRMLKEAGVEVPQSVAELKKAGAKIKKDSGKTGLYLRGDDPYWFLPSPYR